MLKLSKLRGAVQTASKVLAITLGNVKSCSESIIRWIISAPTSIRLKSALWNRVARESEVVYDSNCGVPLPLLDVIRKYRTAPKTQKGELMYVLRDDRCVGVMWINPKLLIVAKWNLLLPTDQAQDPWDVVAWNMSAATLADEDILKGVVSKLYFGETVYNPTDTGLDYIVSRILTALDRPASGSTLLRELKVISAHTVIRSEMSCGPQPVYHSFTLGPKNPTSNRICLHVLWDKTGTTPWSVMQLSVVNDITLAYDAIDAALVPAKSTFTPLPYWEIGDYLTTASIPAAHIGRMLDIWNHLLTLVSPSK